MSSSPPKNGTRRLTPAEVAAASAAVWQFSAIATCRGERRGRRGGGVTGG